MISLGLDAATSTSPRARRCLGGVLSLGSIAGGRMGVRLSLSANAKRYVFVLLVLAISAELVQLAWHHFFRAMWPAE